MALTAHQLAHQLLNGADYPVVVKTDEVSEHEAFAILGSIGSMSMLNARNNNDITQPCIVICRGRQPVDVLSHSR